MGFGTSKTSVIGFFSAKIIVGNMFNFLNLHEATWKKTNKMGSLQELKEKEKKYM